MEDSKMKATILTKEIKGDVEKGTAEINGQKFEYEIIRLGGEPHNLAIKQGYVKKETVRGLPNFEKVLAQFNAYGLL